MPVNITTETVRVHRTSWTTVASSRLNATTDVVEQYYRKNSKKPFKVRYLFGCKDTSGAEPSDILIINMEY